MRLGSTKGLHFSLIQPSDLILVDHDGKILEESGSVRRLNLAAFMIHSAIHAARPDVICAAHSHSLYGRAFSTLGRELDMITQDSCQFYEVSSRLMCPRNVYLYMTFLGPCGLQAIQRSGIGCWGKYLGGGSLLALFRTKILSRKEPILLVHWVRGRFVLASSLPFKKLNAHTRLLYYRLAPANYYLSLAYFRTVEPWPSRCYLYNWGYGIIFAYHFLDLNSGDLVNRCSSIRLSKNAAAFSYLLMQPP